MLLREKRVLVFCDKSNVIKAKKRNRKFFCPLWCKFLLLGDGVEAYMSLDIIYEIEYITAVQKFTGINFTLRLQSRNVEIRLT